MSHDSERYYVVHESIMPEALLKTVQAKEMLAGGKAKTVHEAVEAAGLSRSAFYKYKEGVIAFHQIESERMVAISLNLQHRAGILSKVLAEIAALQGNVMTIHQAIPLQGVANVILTVNVAGMEGTIDQLLCRLKALDGVGRTQLVGQGKTIDQRLEEQ